MGVIALASPLAGYEEHKTEIDQVIQRFCAAGHYILGAEVAAFEKNFAEFVGVAHGVGVANGTDAVELALRSVGVGAGDVVITVSHTAVATVAGIERIGAIPFLVDIDPDSFCMSPASLELALRECQSSGKPARAVVPVHLYGQPADLKSIIALARKYGAKVVEDCAQAHGARYEGKSVGSFADASAFSFYPTKNLGALGDGGLVATNDDATYQTLLALRQYGWKERYISHLSGVNSRLDEMQAAVLSVKLKYLANDNQRRVKLAETYAHSLEGLDIALPRPRGQVSHVFHLYVIRTSKRAELEKYLAAKGVSVGIHYPQPIHLQPAYKGKIRHVALSATEKAATEILSLPMYPQLKSEQVEEVAQHIKTFFKA